MDFRFRGKNGRAADITVTTDFAPNRTSERYADDRQAAQSFQRPLTSLRRFDILQFGAAGRESIMRPLLQLRHAFPALAVAVFLFAFALGTPRAASPAASAAQGDFAGFVDIGAGRRLYLECRGTGSPVVVLEAGYRSSARIWSEDLHQSGAPRTMVLAGVGVFTRVCAYDRPGTVAALNDNVRQSRSDPVPMPRTALDVVADLHALLRAAGVPAPYVFAGHSLGGLFVRLYASTYPRDVLGLVLVDAYSEMLETLFTPERWAALVRLNVRSGSDTVKPIPSYGDLETIGYGKHNAVMRQAAATTPLGPMPLAVLAHALPFDLPKEAEGFSSDALESVLRAANENLATLVPNARFFVAKDSGHDIHQDQPELVIEAIRQVVVGVRHPATWYDLTSCCAK
jgi:pimeloyl-ACP methyl ester carboxylesterase